MVVNSMWLKLSLPYSIFPLTKNSLDKNSSLGQKKKKQALTWVGTFCTMKYPTGKIPKQLVL